MSASFDDGTYVITENTFSTPTRLYPLTHATARIRRDLVWLALAAIAISSASIVIYADLLTWKEIAVLASLPMIACGVAANMGILAIDAPGHQRSLIFARMKKVRALFDAIRRARLAEFSGSLPQSEEQIRWSSIS